MDPKILNLEAEIRKGKYPLIWISSQTNLGHLHQQFFNFLIFLEKGFSLSQKELAKVFHTKTFTYFTPLRPGTYRDRFVYNQSPQIIDLFKKSVNLKITPAGLENSLLIHLSKKFKYLILYVPNVDRYMLGLISNLVAQLRQTQPQFISAIILTPSLIRYSTVNLCDLILEVKKDSSQIEILSNPQNNPTHRYYLNPLNGEVSEEPIGALKFRF